MLEETAGTSLYNDMKASALKLMEKKDDKLEKMNSLLVNEIEP